MPELFVRPGKVGVPIPRAPGVVLRRVKGHDEFVGAVPASGCRVDDSPYIRARLKCGDLVVVQEIDAGEARPARKPRKAAAGEE